MNKDKFHRAFGVYGIITIDNALVVIMKNGGPYINRFDLPGGSLEDGEFLKDAIIREINEETGLKVSKLNQLGTTSFRYPWHYLDYEMNQHIAVFYQVSEYEGALLEKVAQFDGQDSLGAVLVSLNDLNGQNASPLVLKAKDYLEHKSFATEDVEYQSWHVLSDGEQVFKK